MDDRKRSFGEGVNDRVAARLFDCAFEACERLPDADQQLLLKEIAKRILRQMPNPPSEEQTAVKVIGIKIKQA
jgi:hypothetical protein